eukprot:2569920-Prorocentrum_lima.AAC.1
MTSSLVGSEMCIRDSKMAEHSGIPPRWHVMPAARAIPYIPVWLCCSKAVSYTHLTLPTICSV